MSAVCLSASSIWSSLSSLLPSFPRISLSQFPSSGTAPFRATYQAPVLSITSAHLSQELSLSFEEALVLVVAVVRGTLHQQTVTVGGMGFVVTSVKEGRWYARGMDVQKEMGMVIVKLKKVVIVLVYAKPHSQPLMISNVEALAEELQAMDL